MAKLAKTEESIVVAAMGFTGGSVLGGNVYVSRFLNADVDLYKRYSSQNWDLAAVERAGEEKVPATEFDKVR